MNISAPAKIRNFTDFFDKRSCTYTTSCILWMSIFKQHSNQINTCDPSLTLKLFFLGLRTGSASVSENAPWLESLLLFLRGDPGMSRSYEKVFAIV